jgi:hypothetical protein
MLAAVRPARPVIDGRNRAGYLLKPLAGIFARILTVRETTGMVTSNTTPPVLSAPLTHSDWMMHAGLVWGPQGVRHMLERCKDAGWTRIYWRVTDGGRAAFPSTVMRPLHTWDPDNHLNPAHTEDMERAGGILPPREAAERRALLERLQSFDYGAFDPLAEAVRYGHAVGLEVHAWVTINEDDHGWGLASDFAKAHPEMRWRRRDGRAYRSQLSFAFPEVRANKLAFLREVGGNYAIDGLFLDWIRTGDVRDNPQNDPDGVADYGYEAPLTGGFRADYGIDPHDIPNGDPRWVAYRAAPQTTFMRDVRALPELAGKPVAVLVGHPWHYRGDRDAIDGNLRGLLLDVGAWAREGLIDAAVPAGYYLDGGTPERAWSALREETGGKVAVWYYAWVPERPEDFHRDHGAALRLGAPQVLFWEADYIETRPMREALNAAMRTVSLEQAGG